MNPINKSESFTLAEIIIVVGILAAVTGFAFLELSTFKNRQNFNLDAENIVNAIQNAQGKSVQQENGNSWGVQFINGTSSDIYSVFQGTAYSASSVVTVEPLSSATVYSNPVTSSSSSVVFSKRSGTPASGNALVVTLKQTGGNGVYTVSVSSAGRISKNLESNFTEYLPMDESTGTTAYDASGSGNDGTMYAAAIPTYILTTGCKAGNYCGSFNGSNNYIKTNNTFNLSGTDKITISMWIKYTSTGSTLPLEHSTNFNSNNAFIVATKDQGGAGSLEFGDHNSGYNIVYTSNAYNDGNWHFFVVTSDRSQNGSNQSHIYVDGTDDTVHPGSYSADLSGNYGNFTLYLGSRAGSSSFFPGTIDDFRIYGRVLSATEVKNLYNSY